jgi:hypothetical protein
MKAVQSPMVLVSYGGFPKILKEEHGGATDAFRDDNLGDVATRPYEALESAHAAARQALYDFERLPHHEKMKDPSAGFKLGMAEQAAFMDMVRHPEHQQRFAAKKAAEEAARVARIAAMADMDIHNIDRDDIVAASFGRRIPQETDSPEARGTNMGPRSLPPTDYDLGISGPEERRGRRR